MRLFIVDDDADDRRLFIEAVKEVDESIECITAGDGEQALAMLHDTERSLPDVIFLDIRMPRINGKKCLFEIKNDMRLRHIPVIMFTTSKDVEESRILKEMGAFYFISKPNDPGEIYYLISFVLEAQLKAARKDNC